MLDFIITICWESMCIIFGNRMPYGRWVCNKVVDLITVCFNFYNATFIHSRLQINKNVTSSADL